MDEWTLDPGSEPGEIRLCFDQKTPCSVPTAVPIRSLQASPAIKSRLFSARFTDSETRCVSGRLNAAVIFPLPGPGKPLEKWLYILAVDTKTILILTPCRWTKLWNWDKMPAVCSAHPNEVMFWLRAQELAVDQVPAANIIGAVKFIRAFNENLTREQGVHMPLKQQDRTKRSMAKKQL
jgi:hypothetical protein